MKKSFILFFLSLALVLSEVFVSQEFQGAQIIDTKQSFMTNLRYDNITNRLYYRADKSTPNVFFATIAPGNDSTSFTTDTVSPLLASTPAFFAFDVMTHKTIDFVVGSALDSSENRMGLPLLVAGTNKQNSPLVNYDDWYLYTPHIDRATIDLTTNKVDVYFVGWSYNVAKFGLIVARAVAVLNPTSPSSISVKVDDVLVLNDTCFDVFTELNKPRLHIDTFDNAKTLIVTVPGRCDAFYKVKVDPVLSKSSYQVFTETDTLNSDIFSSTYDWKSKRLFYAYKQYNSDKISVHQFNVATFTPMPVYKSLGHNDTNPILSYDYHTDSLIFTSSDFDHIYKIPGDKLNTPNPNIATLPQKIKAVSSTYVIGDFLYLVTFEADAQLARIQISKHFCTFFCGTYGYCAAQPNLCQCAQGYEFNITQTSIDIKDCIPKHEVDIIQNIIIERGAVIAFVILFFAAVIAGIAGWVMWWRSRQSMYSSM